MHFLPYAASPTHTSPSLARRDGGPAGYHGAVSPLADFSFDYPDLTFTPAANFTR